MKNIPDNPRVIIVGGGVIGCSVAYHLAKLGWSDIVLLEQAKIAGGTSWHAAGMVGQLRTSNSLTKINKYSVELYKNISKKTKLSIGWNQCGSLILGATDQRMIQLQRTAAMAKVFGVNAELIDSQKCLEKWPVMSNEGITGGVWLPDDGKVEPEKLAQCLAKCAKDNGVKIFEGISVDKILIKENLVYGVQTNQGEIKSEWTIICGGMWARQLGMDIGVDIPLYPVEHHYVISETVKGVTANLPCVREPDEMIYFRSEDDGGIRLGGFQKISKPWKVNRIPKDFSFKLLDPDWDYFKQPLQSGKRRIPQLQDCQFQKFVNGPESFTPDNNFIMGMPPGCKGLFVLAGFNSVGIASAGGAGKYASEWLDAGYPTMDLWSVDIRRFSSIQNDTEYLTGRVVEVLGLHYQMAWPNREMETSRNIRFTPLYSRLRKKGACFGVSACWERANWFDENSNNPKVEYSFEKQNWSQQVADEVSACRNEVAVLDQSTFTKFKLIGSDSLKYLQLHCGNNIDISINSIAYTAMLNERGGFESDVTITRLNTDEFYIVSSTNQRVSDFDRISRELAYSGFDAILNDITEDKCVISIMGPKSRLIMQLISEVDFSNDSFPFANSKNIIINGVSVLAQRLTYVGELGWELHIPWDDALKVYDYIFDLGSKFHLKNAGSYAINTMRIEKAFRAWGHELSTDDTPLEAGLSFAIDWNKDFIGRDALIRQKKDGVKKRMLSFILQESNASLWGNEPIIFNGKIVGYTTSAAFSSTLGFPVAMGYVEINHTNNSITEIINNSFFEILTNGKTFIAKASIKAPYDPGRSKVLM